MNSQRMSSNTMRKGARVVATEIVREPVKEAVRDALREEAVSVTSTRDEPDASSGRRSGDRSSMGQKGSSDGGGRSKLAMLGVVLAIAGVAVLARRRMSSASGSAWSEPSPDAAAEDDAESGYVSEGEMQTAEAGGDQETD